MDLPSMGIVWLTIAALLGLAELIVPGVFLVFIAIAAGITGIVTLALPSLPLVGQLFLLGFWSVLSVVFVRRWYLNSPIESADPMLNDRGARVVGEIVTVTEPIDQGRGRVRLGDSEWLATGPDLGLGMRARVVSMDATAVRVEPLPPSLTSDAA